MAFFRSAVFLIENGTGYAPHVHFSGHPPQSLSRAIEEALPPQDPDSESIKDCRATARAPRAQPLSRRLLDDAVAE